LLCDLLRRTPIDRALAGPGPLADTIVRRWQDHLPLHRLERIYGREGLELARSTVCGWHGALAELAKPLVDAMWTDAFTAPYLCTDATGVLVQAREKCRRGHFWVVIAPERHVLFGYTAKHDSAAVDGLLEGYEGYLVADAHAVFDHLYKRGTLVEVACWAHLRRYWFKALTTDPERARQAMAYIGGLFRLERAWATAPPEERFKIRLDEAKPIVDAFFEWCEQGAGHALDETPPAIRAAIYARVSSLAQRDQQTIASQLEALPKFVSLRGWQLVKPADTYVDDGRTAKAGYLSERLGFTRLLHDAGLGLFDVVVVVDLDRLTRSEDLRERGEVLGAFQKAEVQIAVSSSGQVLDLRSSMGDLMSSLGAFFAAEENRKRRDRICRGKAEAIRRGRKPAGPTPFGYLYDRKSR